MKKISKKAIFLPILCIIISLLICVTTSCIDTSNKNPIVTIQMDPTSKTQIGGTIQIELYPDKAPNSVNYFIGLVLNGFYNDCYVTKVMAGHLVEFGDPWYLKKNDRVIAGEFADNGYTDNDIEFVRGTVGLALDTDKEGNIDNDSAMGDFFVVLSDEAGESYLGKRAAIGKIIAGLDILDEISRIKNYPNYQPVYSARTETATLDLKGQTYPKAVTTKRKYYAGYVTEDFINGTE